MKKKLLVLTLSLGLLVLGASSAFADDTTYRNGHMFYDSGKTVEEIHALKIERIDQLVKDGTITAEKGEEYKKAIVERQSTCDSLGANRDDHERLGIGFGSEDGQKDGSGYKRGGNHGGFRNR